jgi:hypothetical protein
MKTRLILQCCTLFGFHVSGQNRFSICDFGAVADGKTDNTAAIRKAIDAHNFKEYTPGTLRGIFRDAGVLLWADEGMPVFANGRFFSIHTKEGGKKTIRLPRKCAKVTELISGRQVAADAEAVEYDFGTPDTRLFLME